jgi:hypothetical protein
MTWSGFASYLTIVVAAIIAIIPASFALKCMDDNKNYKEQQQGLYITSVVGLVLQILFIAGASISFWMFTRDQTLNNATMLFIITLIIASFGLIPSSVGINCMNSNSSYENSNKGAYGTSLTSLILQVLFIVGTCVLFGISVTEHNIQLSR